MEDGARAIHDVVLRYCRAVDTQDWDTVRRCFHPHAVDHHATYDGDVDGFLKWVEEETAKYRQTMHFAGNHYVEIKGEQSIAETYVMVTHVGIEPQEPTNFTSGVRYIDYMERKNGIWAITERWAVRDWVRLDVGAFTAPTGPVTPRVDRLAEARKLLAARN